MTPQNKNVSQAVPADYGVHSCHNLQLDIIYQQADWLGADWQAKDILGALAIRAAYAAFTHTHAEKQIDADRLCELSLYLTDDAEICRLNTKWRGQARPTNVLAFPANDGRHDVLVLEAKNVKASRKDLPPLMLGDIVLARETILREAHAAGKTPFDHFQHLVVHGVLHLLGYDHIDATEAVIMETLERHILSGLGVSYTDNFLFDETISPKTNRAKNLRKTKSPASACKSHVPG